MTDSDTLEDDAERCNALAQQVWDRWESGTLAWLQSVGVWSKVEREDADFELGDEDVALTTGGIVEVRHSGLGQSVPLDLVGFNVVLREHDPDHEVADLVARALDSAIIGRADMVVRAAGRTEPTGLASHTGSLACRMFTDDDDLVHFVGRMKLGMAIKMADVVDVPDEDDEEPETAGLPPAEIAEPEGEITQHVDETPAKSPAKKAAATKKAAG